MSGGPLVAGVSALIRFHPLSPLGDRYYQTLFLFVPDERAESERLSAWPKVRHLVREAGVGNLDTEGGLRGVESLPPLSPNPHFRGLAVWLLFAFKGEKCMRMRMPAGRFLGNRLCRPAPQLVSDPPRESSLSVIPQLYRPPSGTP